MTPEQIAEETWARMNLEMGRDAWSDNFMRASIAAAIHEATAPLQAECDRRGRLLAEHGIEGSPPPWPTPMQRLQAELDAAKAECECIKSTWDMPGLRAERDAALARAAAAENFKTWVHARLDEGGVPPDPDPEGNKRHGCRISGRMQWLFDRLETDRNQTRTNAHTMEVLHARLRQERSTNATLGAKWDAEGKRLEAEVERLKGELEWAQKPLLSETDMMRFYGDRMVEHRNNAIASRKRAEKAEADRDSFASRLDAVLNTLATTEKEEYGDAITERLEADEAGSVA
jgi:hypothetical protein